MIKTSISRQSKNRLEIFKSQAYSIVIDKNSNVTILKWLSFTTSISFRESMQHAFRIVEEYNTPHLILNAKHFGAIVPNDQEWSSDLLLEKVKELSLKVLCIISPTDIFGQVSIKMMVQNAMKKRLDYNDLKFNYNFKKTNAAVNWIKLLDLSQKSKATFATAQTVQM